FSRSGSIRYSRPVRVAVFTFFGLFNGRDSKLSKPNLSIQEIFCPFVISDLHISSGGVVNDRKDRPSNNALCFAANSRNAASNSRDLPLSLTTSNDPADLMSKDLDFLT